QVPRPPARGADRLRCRQGELRGHRARLDRGRGGGERRERAARRRSPEQLVHCDVPADRGAGGPDGPAALPGRPPGGPDVGRPGRQGAAPDNIPLVYHEHTNAVTARPPADADWVEQLSGHQADSINEATSDWYAMDYIVSQGFVTDTATSGEAKTGGYVDRG